MTRIRYQINVVNGGFIMHECLREPGSDWSDGQAYVAESEDTLFDWLRARIKEDEEQE